MRLSRDIPQLVFSFSINKYMSNSNLTFPTNELKKNKKMQSTLTWQTVSRVVNGLGWVGFLSNLKGLE